MLCSSFHQESLESGMALGEALTQKWQKQCHVTSLQILRRSYSSVLAWMEFWVLHRVKKDKEESCPLLQLSQRGSCPRRKAMSHHANGHGTHLPAAASESPGDSSSQAQSGQRIVRNNNKSLLSEAIQF